MTASPRIFAGVVFALAAAGVAGGAGLEDALDRELRGAWSVVLVEVYSNCAGAYNNNQLSGGGVSSRADLRFEPGDLAKIDRINLKRARLDLFLSLSEPVLLARQDGPFELYDERSCQVQLMVDLPREWVKRGDLAAILGRLDEVVERHSGLAGATASRAWNGRRRDPYPADYEDTLARHAVWQAEQTNATVADAREAAMADAVRLAAGVDDDPFYAEGLAAGLAAAADWRETDCTELLNAPLERLLVDPPSDRVGDGKAAQRFREGWDDGQRLGFAVARAYLLGGCFVPVPPLPG